MLFSEISNLNKAMALSYFELLGNAADKNIEMERYKQVTQNELQRIAKEILIPENCSTLYYKSKQN